MSKANQRAREQTQAIKAGKYQQRKKPHTHYSQGDTGYVPQGVGTNPYTDGRKWR